MTGRERAEGKRGRKPEEEEEEAKGEEENPMKGGPPPDPPYPHRIPTSSRIRRFESIEDRVPDVRLQIGTIVLIQSFSRSRIMAAYFEGFSDL